MRQTKLESLLESCLNTASGFIIGISITTFLTYFKNPVIYLGDGLTPHEIFLWTLLMTVVSVLRSYIWRRCFNAEIHKLVHKVASKLLEKEQEE